MNGRRSALIALVLILVILLMPVLEPTICDCDARGHYRTERKSEWRCIGTFRITAYSYDEGGGENYQTEGGYTPSAWYTTATDTDIIPMGTVYKIEGIGTVQAQDTGSAIHGNIIDLHVGHTNPDSFGVQYRKVYIKET